MAPKQTALAFKVLVEGESCHGGSLVWSLPVTKDDGSIEPGEWHSVDGKIQVCVRGLHLTHKPVKLSDLAAVIDRRKDGTVEFHAAPWSDAPASEETAS